MRLVGILLLGLLALRLQAEPRVAAITRALHDSAAPGVLVVAHRADWRAFPENSLPAIRSAIEMGVDIIEIDVQRTKDGVLVVMHDKTLDRSTTGTGFVSDRSWSELREYRLRDGLGIATPYVIPTLEEALLAVKGRAMINLDKCYPFFAEAMAVLEKTGTVDHAIFKTDLPRQMVQQEHGAVWERVAFMPMVWLDRPGSRKILQDYLAGNGRKPVAVELLFAQEPPDLPDILAQIHHSGMRVWINAMWPDLCASRDDERALLDPDGTYGWLVENRATILQTDRPSYLLSYLKKRALR